MNETTFSTVWRHKKTGQVYRWLADGVDCTNSRDGTMVVIYCPDDCEHTVFVREHDEFYEKFEIVS
jgi:hypothetical protein